MIIDDTKNILNDTKFMKPDDWQPVAVEELKNLDNYKKIFQTQADKIDKNSEEYKNLINLFPKLFETVQKLVKNRGELDFDDSAAQDALDGAPGTKKEAAAGTAGAVKAADIEETDEKADLFTKTISATVAVFYYLTLLLLSVLGVSLATNLNVHREIPYRVLYMVYGFIFGRIVVPYVILYRWAYLGKRPHYFSFIPLIDKPFASPTVQKILSWMTYIPDEKEIEKLRTGH
jgi:ABC-type sugar transport system permease subunit